MELLYAKIEFRPHKTKNDNYRKYTESEFIESFNVILEELKKHGFPELLNDIPPVFFHSGGPLGFCSFVNSIYPVRISFSLELLDGKSYTLLEIEDTIRHELVHLVANRRHLRNIDHEDKLFKEIANELECTSVAGGLIWQGELQLSINKVDAGGKAEMYYLYCAKCGELQKLGNSFDAFNFFLFCNMFPEMPTRYGELSSRTKCCRSHYTIVFQIENMVEELSQSNQLLELRGILMEFINEKKE